MDISGELNEQIRDRYIGIRIPIIVLWSESFLRTSLGTSSESLQTRPLISQELWVLYQFFNLSSEVIRTGVAGRLKSGIPLSIRPSSHTSGFRVKIPLTVTTSVPKDLSRRDNLRRQGLNGGK